MIHVSTLKRHLSGLKWVVSWKVDRRRRAPMSSALSTDLRQRMVHAVETGATRHQAAKRFGVSLASASRWCGQFACEGHVAAKPMGGDQRLHRIEAHGVPDRRIWRAST